MSYLDKVSKPTDDPIICTILSDAGMGKTSLGATFPKPIFIQAEKGVKSIPEDRRPDAFPVIKDVEELWKQLAALINEEHDYKTVVIDSATALERIFAQKVIDDDPKKPKSLNQACGGYGAGYEAVAQLHRRVRNAASMLQDKGINVVFLAHAEIENVDLPDVDPYGRYTVRMHKKSLPYYIDDVDLVGYIKLETFTMGEGDRKKAISDGSRVLVTYATAANVSKNRYQITQDLPVVLGENPLVPFVKSLQKQ